MKRTMNTIVMTEAIANIVVSSPELSCACAFTEEPMLQRSSKKKQNEMLETEFMLIFLSVEKNRRYVEVLFFERQILLWSTQCKLLGAGVDVWTFSLVVK